MTRRSKLLLAFLVAAGGAVLTVTFSSQRHLCAVQRLNDARLSLAATLSDARETNLLRAKHERIGLRARPAQDVIAQVNGVLAETGLDASCLRSLTPDSESSLAASASSAGSDARYRRQSVRLLLVGLSAGELGRFLVRWNQVQTIWTPVRIELSHARNTPGPPGQSLNPTRSGAAYAPGGGGGGAGGADRYDASILLSALYLADT